MGTVMQEKNGKLRIFLAGEVDHHRARGIMEEIEDAVERNLPRECILNLRDVTFMDSSGIALVLKTHRRMNEIGGRVLVESVPQQAMRVFTASAIDRIISVKADT